jgi:hypothetical protein
VRRGVPEGLFGSLISHLKLAARGVYQSHARDKETGPVTVDSKDLPPAAQRALAEAEERRKISDAKSFPTELGGRDGPEPIRYGDWERKGIAVDF